MNSRDETISFLNGYLHAASKRAFFLEMLQEAQEAGSGERVLADLREKADRESMVMQTVLDVIGGMHAEIEKRVLFYRFVKGLSNRKIADHMGYSKRQVQRLCAAGLDLLGEEMEKRGGS